MGEKLKITPIFQHIESSQIFNLIGDNTKMKNFLNNSEIPLKSGINDIL
jgi:hypothetical protein